MSLPGLPPLAVCERARLARDPRFDGLFFVAVRTTRIYCRPICPAPQPKAANVSYYPNAAAAAAAGYRPCLRCRPELAAGDPRLRPAADLVSRALRLIADGAMDEDGVEGLAGRIGLGARQLRRLFLAEVGAPPIAVQATRRLLFAKQLLADTALPITDVALAAGFRSLRRFNAAFREACRMPPRAIRRDRRALPGEPLRLRLGFRPPYDFAALLAFFRSRAIPGVEQVDAARYVRVLGTTDAPALLELAPSADGRALELVVRGVPPTGLQAVVARVRRMFDLDADPARINAELARAPLLRPRVRRYPGQRVPGCWDGFELAVRAVLGQQVSVAAARTLATRIVTTYGSRLPAAFAPGLDALFPTPDALADAPLERLGLTGQRARTVRAVARGFADGTLAVRRDDALDAFVARWTALPGIGPWTAQYLALRALGDPDAFPAGDLVLQKMAAGDGGRLRERELAALAESWRPWRAYAVLHLWRWAGERAAAREAA